MLPVAGALERLGIAYFVGGSVASTAHGYPRSTVDADLVADVQFGHVAALVAALEADYYIDAEMVREAIADRSCFNVIHLPTMFKVDVFVSKNRAFDREVFARKARRAVDPGEPESELFLASAEDIILAKLEWYRLGNEVSERQWRDVQGVVKMQWQRLDRAYLAKWAAALEVADLLERAWHEAGGDPS
ncbi:MAG: hypothetical protein GXY83_40725 [Rhodopirellula sp.]|nr:hypothetical protein [Rhodopirellula sp.]